MEPEAKEIKENKELKENKENKEEKELKDQKLLKEEIRDKSGESEQLNENQIKEIIDSDEFVTFFENSTKLIEKV